MAEANYKFLYINYGSKGSTSDGGVWGNCTFSKELYNQDANVLSIPPPKPLTGRSKPIPYCIVADDAFPIKVNIMKPYSQRQTNVPQRVFNYRLSRARRIIENAFGIASNRFRIMRRTIDSSPEKATIVTCAICVLHNFLITRSQHLYTPPDSFNTALTQMMVQSD